MTKTQTSRRTMWQAVAVLAMAAISAQLIGTAAAGAETAPANDAFAAAAVLEGTTGQVVTSTIGATTEVGEPEHADVGEASVWFSWTAPLTGAATFTTSDSDFDTVLAVYTGPGVGALTEVAANDDFGGLQSQVTFHVGAGTTYAIAGAGYQGDTGTLVLGWHASETPGNDSFVDATVLDGPSGTVSGSTTLATTEVGEPAHALYGRSSVWFRWTAARDSLLSLDTIGSRLNSVLAVYTGTAVDGLSLVAEFSHPTEETHLSFPASAGTTYAVAVAGFNGATGPYTLNYAATDPVPTAANDDFASATVLAGAVGTDEGTTDMTTNEPGEPRHDRWGTRSVWFSWTAPANGAVTFTVEGTGFDAILGVYTGATVDAVTRVTSDDGSVGGDRSLVVFYAREGVTYAVAVSGQLGATGPYQLTWALRQPPANDMFADRHELAGRQGSFTGSSQLATQEPGEPFHAGTGSASVWFSWTAPTDGVATFDSGGFNTVVAVYRGDALRGLAPVAANDDAFDASVGSNVVFTVEAGSTYAIAVAGFGNQTGAYTLDWVVVDPLPNDDFATPTVLDPRGGTVAATNVAATREPDEPQHDGYGYPSVWFSWTAPADGIATFDSTASDIHTVLGVYTGVALDRLEPIGESGGSSFATETRVEFPSQAGQTYAVAVAGFSTLRGPIALDWAFRATTPPTNDDLADAMAIGGASGTVSGTNEGASSEPGEPADGGPRTASVWYSWTAPAGGVVTFDTLGSDVDTVLAVYRGDRVDALHFLAANGLGCCPHARVEVSVAAGQTYRVVVFGFNGSQGSLALSWSLRDAARPVNDDLASAVPLGTPSGYLAGTTVGATPEVGEPLHPGGGTATVWYRFTAPQDGAFRVDTKGRTGDHPPFDTVLAVYTGERASALTEVVANHVPAGLPAQLTLRAQKGITYSIAVAGARGEMGPFHLAWQPVTTAPNDDFGSAMRLRGQAGSVTHSQADADGRMRFATIEPGEPDHAGEEGGASVWFRWQAPASGPVGFDTLAGNPHSDTHMAVYHGRSLSDLTPVTGNDDAPDGRLTSRVAFDATKATVYWIAVDTFRGDDRRGFVLTWRPAPVNDHFADAAPLTGGHGKIGGNNLVASVEAHEPPRILIGGASVWYRWRAPKDGPVRISVEGVAFRSTVSVYRGKTVDQLDQVGASGPRFGLRSAQVMFAATAGETYSIAVDGVRTAAGDHLAEAGDFTLTWHSPPHNDDFADAEVLNGATGSTLGTFGTREPGEPDHGGDGGSVWYRWTPPYAGTASVDTFGSQQLLDEESPYAVFNSVLAVYTIEADGSLRFVAWNDDAGPDDRQSELSFHAQPGLTYAIAAEPSASFGGGPVLKVNWRMAPPHDDFTNAMTMTTRAGRIESTNLLATIEPGEPASGSVGFESSVWFSWTAPLDGRLQVKASSGADTLLTVDAYVGAAVDALTRVNEIDEPPATVQARVDLPVTAGHKYMIAVDGSPGSFTLSWHLTSKPGP